MQSFFDVGELAKDVPGAPLLHQLLLRPVGAGGLPEDVKRPLGDDVEGIALFALRDIPLAQQKLVYLACCIAGLCIGAWKLDKMGLLPLTSADWASMVPMKQYVEFSG